MSPRALRRAEERDAKKLARKANIAAAAHAMPDLVHDQLSEKLDFSQDHTISAARLDANRRNALFSTGPTSEVGKATSSLNALKTGLTGQTVLLPSEDAAEYRAHIADYEKALRPVGRLERDLVQSLADTRWRLNRIPRLEMAIYAQGRLEFDQAFNEFDADQRASMIEVQTFITYEKQLKNLQIQEARLHCRYEKDMKALRELQKKRRSQEEQERATSKRPAASDGFEFSTSFERKPATVQTGIAPTVVNGSSTFGIVNTNERPLS